MKISGKVHEVHNLVGFVKSYLQTDGKPNKQFFTASNSDVVIYVAAVLPEFSFIPQISVKGDVSDSGVFSIDVSRLPTTMDYFMMIQKKVGEMSVLHTTIPIYETVYRSQTFKLKEIKNFYIYFAPYQIPKEKGITEATIKSKVNDIKKNMKELDSANAYINKSNIGVVAKGNGAKVTFNLDINSYIGNDLNRLVKHKISNFDVDLPGPDIFTSLCVSKDKIEREINSSLSGMMKTMSSEIQDGVMTEIAASANLPKSIVKSYFNLHSTLTVAKVPHTFLKMENSPFLSGLQIPVYTINPKISFGFPKEVKSQPFIFKVELLDKFKLNDINKRKVKTSIKEKVK